MTGLSASLSALGGLLALVPPGTESTSYPGPAWSPYLVGALIGVLSMATFYFSDKPIGVSTGLAKLGGLIGMLFAPRHTKSLKYFDDNKPKIEWEVMLIFGVLIGALAAAWSGGEITARWVPEMWEARFGGSVAYRLAIAFAGGALLAFGARLAGGCTSGHGISGALQLSVGSWISLICFFVGGIATAMLMYRM
jgi:uncharacterized protein